jgi:hypothetical protein
MKSDSGYPNFMHVTDNEVPYAKCGSPVQYLTCPWMQPACMTKETSSVISGFRRDVDVICGLLGNVLIHPLGIPSILCFPSIYLLGSPPPLFTSVFIFYVLCYTFIWFHSIWLFTLCYCSFHLVVYSSVLMFILFSIFIPTLIITFLFYFLLL